MRRSKGLAAAIAVASVSLLVISACGGNKGTSTTSTSFADCATKPNDCNAGKTKTGGNLTYTIEKTITGWNVNDANTNTFDIVEALDSILPSPYLAFPDLTYKINDDLLASADVTSTSPQTIVYKIRSEAVWDDGTPISADDFIYAWQTRNGKDCKTCSAANNAGYDQMKSVTGSDGGKTVTVVYDTPFTDWKQPFEYLYPAHLAKQHGDLGASFKWLDETVPTWSGGPYKISEYNKDVSLTQVPNPKWYGKVKPSLDKLIFRIITDQNQTLPALQNNEVQAIYPQPNLDIVNQTKTIPNVQYNLGKGLQWEHFDLQTKNKFLADKTLRQAIFTAVNRQDIIDKSVGQFIPGLKPLNNHNFVPGQDGYKDTVTSTGVGNGDITKARKLLTDAGYTYEGTTLKTSKGEAVTLRISYTTGNTLRKATSEQFQNQMTALGVKVDVVPVTSLGKTLTSGDYDVIIYAWVGTPSVFSGALQLWLSTSDSNYNKWVNPQSDGLLRDAASQTDVKKAIDALNQSDQLLSNDFVVLPLFQKPTFLATYKQYANIRDNATSAGPPYNTQSWGIRAT
jgi:peptide/nickel transport system substrate-binding protein